MANPNDRTPPRGLEEPWHFSNAEAYESILDDPMVLAVGDAIEPAQYDNYGEYLRSRGLEIGNLLLWHRFGPGYTIFPLLKPGGVEGATR